MKESIQLHRYVNVRLAFIYIVFSDYLFHDSRDCYYFPALKASYGEMQIFNPLDTTFLISADPTTKSNMTGQSS